MCEHALPSRRELRQAVGSLRWVIYRMKGKDVCPELCFSGRSLAIISALRRDLVCEEERGDGLVEVHEF